MRTTSPEPSDPLPVCARCAARFPTCCRLGAAGRTAPDGECFPLSGPELDRLAAALPEWGGGLPARLHAPAANSPEFLRAMRALFPGREERLESLYPAGGSHPRLSLRPDGSCVCLGAAGCLLPHQARPWFCRLFPFWFQRGRLTCFTPPDCLAVLENRSLPGLLRAFGQTEARARELFTALCRDWGV